MANVHLCLFRIQISMASIIMTLLWMNGTWSWHFSLAFLWPLLLEGLLSTIYQIMGKCMNERTVHFAQNIVIDQSESNILNTYVFMCHEWTMKFITQLWSSYFSLLCNCILHITSTEKFWNVLFFSVDIWEETDHLLIIQTVLSVWRRAW